MSIEEYKGESHESQIETESRAELTKVIGSYQDRLWVHTEESHRRHRELMDRFNRGEIDRVFLGIESGLILDQNAFDQRVDQKLQNGFKSLVMTGIEVDKKLGSGSSSRIQREIVEGPLSKEMSQGTLKYKLLKEVYGFVRAAREIEEKDKKTGRERSYGEIVAEELHPWAEKELWPRFEDFMSKEDFNSAVEFY